MMTNVDLPSSWALAELADCVQSPRETIVDGPFESNLKASEYTFEGVPIIRLQNIDRNCFLLRNIKFISPSKANSLKRHNFIPGDIVITKLGAPLGKAAIVPSSIQSGIIVADVVRCRVSEELMSAKYLMLALNSPQVTPQFTVQTKGTTRPRVNLKHIRAINLPVAPLPEQHRIVEKIETLFARLDKGEEALRAVQTLLARYRQSVLKAAVTGRLTGSDTETWKLATLGALLEDIRYGTAKKCLPGVEGIAVLRIPNVANGEIDLHELKYTQLDDREVEKLVLKKGDLLIVRSNGSANLVGRGAVVNDDGVGLAFAGYLIRLRVDQKQLLPDFLQLVLSSPIVRARIEREARSTSGVHNLNSGEVKAITFDLPPIDVQAEIIEAVDECMASIGTLMAWCQTELTRSAALRQSVLKDAFSGRLVPQDPNDEPATDLLARIRRNRTAASRSERREATA